MQFIKHQKTHTWALSDGFEMGERHKLEPEYPSSESWSSIEEGENETFL